MKRDRAPLRSYSEGAKLGMPIGLAVKTAAPIVALSARFNEANDENVQRDLAALPALLDRVDELIAAGMIGGEQLNAADFQIAPSIGLAMTLEDLRPAIEGRPAGELAKRVVPDYPGDMPADPAAEWLEPLRGAAPRPSLERTRTARPAGPAAARRARRRGGCRPAASARGRARAAARGRSGGWSPRGAAG